MILEIIEPYLEVINLVVALLVVFLGFQVLIRIKGELKTAWTYFFMAILLFGIHEVIGILSEFGIFEVGGLYAFTEFIYIVAFLISILVFRRLFVQLSERKSIYSKQESKK